MPITHQKSFLDRCAALKRGGIALPIEPGYIVARGFADFGYEEFFVLENGEFCSLLTGERSRMETDSVESLFVVPDADHLLQIIAGSRADITALEFIDNRKWKLCLSLQNGKSCEARGSGLEETLLEGLMSLHEIAIPQAGAPRNLITSKEP